MLISLERNALAVHLKLLDFAAQKPVAEQATTCLLEPVPDPTDCHAIGDDVLENGAQAVRQGQVAVLIMVGGQGSRLRAAGSVPEGADVARYSLEGDPARASAAPRPTPDADVRRRDPVCILTSDVTHSPIAAYLLAHNHFGLKHVVLVKQRQLPARLPDGRFALADKGRVLAAPNGNGAVFQELTELDALSEMRRLGIKFVDIHPIDNALVRPADPLFVGALVYEEAEAAVKILRKFTGERMDTLCRRGGKTIVVEYSEIPPGEEAAHEFGNTALQLYTVDHIEKAAAVDLPYHIARKKEMVLGQDGQQVIGEVLKFERFVFDALEYCHDVALVACGREEFAPIKNAAGAPEDSPETAARLLLRLHRKWADDAGIVIKGDGPSSSGPRQHAQAMGSMASGKKCSTRPRSSKYFECHTALTIECSWQQPCPEHPWRMSFQPISSQPSRGMFRASQTRADMSAKEKS